MTQTPNDPPAVLVLINNTLHVRECYQAQPTEYNKNVAGFTLIQSAKVTANLRRHRCIA
jgi:hypothetical protein